MNRHMKSLAVTMAALACLASASNISARQDHEMDDPGHYAPRFERGPEGGMWHQRRMMHDLRELDLSEQQRQQLQALMQTRHDDRKAKRRARLESRKALREAATADPYDPARVRALAEEQGRMMADMLVRRVDTQRQIRALLTPEQRAKLDDMRAQRDCRHEEH